MRLSWPAFLLLAALIGCSSSLPGPDAGTPGRGTDAIGSLFDFYLGALGDVRFVYAANGAWKPGSIAGTGNSSNPAVVTNPAGKVYVVVTAANGDVLVTRSTTVAFPAWTNLGGGAANLGNGPHFDLPGVGVNADGRVEIFVVAGGKVHHASETASNSGQFGAWSILDDAASPTWSAHPAVARNADGRLELFQIGDNAVLYHKYQNAPSSSDWSFDLRWDAIGSAPTGDLRPGTIGIGTNNDGRLEFFVESSVSGSNLFQLFHQWQTVPGGGWSGWEDLHLTATAESRPALTLDRFGAEGYQYLFVLQGSALVYKRQVVTNGGWGDWANLGGSWTASPKLIHTDVIYLIESDGAGGSVNKSQLGVIPASCPDAGGPCTPAIYLGQSWPAGWQTLY